MFAVRLIVACCVVHSITCFRRPRDPENCEPDPTTLVLELDEHVENTKSVGEPPAPEQDADGKLEDVKSIGETHVIGFYPLGSEYPMTGSVTCVEVAFPVTPLIVIDGFVELHTSKSMLQASNYYYDEFNVNVNVKFFMGVLKFSVGLYGRVQTETFTHGAETDFFNLMQRSLVRFAKNSVMKNPHHVQALSDQAEHLSLLNLQLGPNDKEIANREQVAKGLVEALRHVGPGIREVFSSFRKASTGLWAILREHAQSDDPPDLRRKIKGIRPTYVGRTPTHLSNVKIVEGYLRTIVLKMVYDIAKAIAEALFFGSGNNAIKVYKRDKSGNGVIGLRDQAKRQKKLRRFLLCVSDCEDICNLAPVWLEKNEQKVFGAYLCRNLETWKDSAFMDMDLEQKSPQRADPCSLDGHAETRDICENPERKLRSGVKCVFLPQEVAGWRCCSASDVGSLDNVHRCGSSRHGLDKVNKDTTDASGQWLRNPWFPNVYRILSHFRSRRFTACKPDDFSSCVIKVPLAVANAFPAIFSAFRDFFDYLDATVFNQVATSRNFTAATALSCKQDVSCVTELLSMDLPDMNVIRNVMYEFEKIVLNDDVFPQPRDGSKDTYDYESWALSEWKSPFAGNKAVPKQTTFKTSVRRFKCGICKESNLPSCFSVDLFTYPVLRQRACRFMNRCSDDVVLRHTCKTNVSHREYLAANPDASGQDFTCDVPLRAFTIAEMASTRIQLAENVCSELIESIELGTPLGNKCSRCEGGRAPNCLKMNAPRKSNSFKKCQFVNSCTETPFILYHSCSRGLSSASLLPGQDLECDMPQESHSSDFDAQDRCAGLIKSIKPDVASHTKARFDEKCPSCTDSGVFPSVAECLSLSLNDKETHCVVSWKRDLNGKFKCIGASPELPPAVHILHHCVRGNGAMRGEAYVYPLGKKTWKCPVEIAKVFAATVIQPDPPARSACEDIIAEIRPYGINGRNLPSCLYFSLGKPRFTNAKRAILDSNGGTLWDCKLTNECNNELFTIERPDESVRLSGTKKHFNFGVTAPNKFEAWDACVKNISVKANTSTGDALLKQMKLSSFRRFPSFLESASEGCSSERGAHEKADGGGQRPPPPPPAPLPMERAKKRKKKQKSPERKMQFAEDDIGESFKIETRSKRIPLASVAETADEPSSDISFGILEFVDREGRLVEDVMKEADGLAKQMLSEQECGSKTKLPNNTRARCATLTLSLAVSLQLGTPEILDSNCLGPQLSTTTRLDVLMPRPSYKFRGESLLPESTAQTVKNSVNEVLGLFHDPIRWDVVADNPRETLSETGQVQHAYGLPVDFTWSVFTPVPMPLSFEINYYSSPWIREARTLPGGLSAFLTLTLPIPVCPCFLPVETLLNAVADILRKIYHFFVSVMSKVRETIRKILSDLTVNLITLDVIKKVKEALRKYLDKHKWISKHMFNEKIWEDIISKYKKDIKLPDSPRIDAMFSLTKYKRVNFVASIVGSPSCQDADDCTYSSHHVSFELQCIASAGYLMFSSPWGSVGGVRYMVSKFDVGTAVNQILYSLGEFAAIPANSTALEKAQSVAIIAGTALKRSDVLPYIQSTFMTNLIIGTTEKITQEVVSASVPYLETAQARAEEYQEMAAHVQEAKDTYEDAQARAQEVYENLPRDKDSARLGAQDMSAQLGGQIEDIGLNVHENSADVSSRATQGLESALAGAQELGAQQGDLHATALPVQETTAATVPNVSSRAAQGLESALAGAQELGAQQGDLHATGLPVQENTAAIVPNVSSRAAQGLESALAGAQELGAQQGDLHATGLPVQENTAAIVPNVSSRAAQGLESALAGAQELGAQQGDLHATGLPVHGFTDVDKAVLSVHISGADVGEPLARLADAFGELDSTHAQNGKDALVATMFGDTTQLEAFRTDIENNNDLPPEAKKQLLENIDKLLAESDRLTVNKDRIAELSSQLVAAKALEVAAAKAIGRK
eukprot:TRINITY_DN815_c0_g2_i1.p1 TRINITY_DN815_c0_g2~~TRINITY_DN815_c0_g2_i1.p1  ORF type:complete len:1967 (-),score=179.63 TRINITY_DN815_c0_g2_i1:260-6160(-)